MSREMRVFPTSEVGTSPSTIRRAKPSTTAVFPTPGSPIRTGLFLVRRERTWIVRRTSSSRPITGSILPSRASAVRSRPYLLSAWKVPSGSCVFTRALPFVSNRAWSNNSPVAPFVESIFLTVESPLCARAMRRCSVLTYLSPRSLASTSASLRTVRVMRLNFGAATVDPEAEGSACKSARTLVLKVGTSTPRYSSRAVAIPGPCCNSESRR